MSDKILIALTPKQVKEVVKQDQQNRLSKTTETTYSIVDAAGLLGRNTSTLFRYINDGLLQRIYEGKSPKITESEIKRFLNAEKSKKRTNK